MPKANLTLGLIKNPLSSAKLTQNNFLHGLIGLILASGGFFTVFVGNFHSPVRKPVADLVFGNLSEPNHFGIMILGLVVISVPLLAVYLFANMFGQQKLTIKQAVAKFGSTQLFTGLWLFVAGFLAFVSTPVAFVLFLIGLIINAVAVTVVGLNACKVKEEKQASVVVWSMTVYVALEALISMVYFG